MRVALFYHSLVSDWNHGNAHFLRGIVGELMIRAHEVEVFEPENGWSYANLLTEHGEQAIRNFHRRFPHMDSTRYDPGTIDLDRALEGADLILVHEWNEPELVARIGEYHKRSSNAILFFHDTHHRSITDPGGMTKYDLRNYDGVLAYGAILRRIYLDRRWARRVWTWHEAADLSVFQPPAISQPVEGDVVWIGNWGDDERTAELHEFLIEPVRDLGLRARVYGVRYPATAIQALRAAGIEYGGCLPNYEVPSVFARYRVTLHIPRRPYATTLPGIPTIRVFEALACGIPLISAPWRDSEGLFHPGEDFLVARSGEEMKAHLQNILGDPELASRLAQKGRRAILERHACTHRVDELLRICEEVGMPQKAASMA
jgi:spore maturation protein CgeB